MATFDASRLDPAVFQAEYQRYQGDHPGVVEDARADYEAALPGSLEDELHEAEQGTRDFDAAVDQAARAVDQEVGKGFFSSVALTPAQLRDIYIQQQREHEGALKDQAGDPPAGSSGALKQNRVRFDCRFGDVGRLGTDPDGEVDFTALAHLPELEQDSRDVLGSVVAQRNQIVAVYEKARQAVFAEGSSRADGRSGLHEAHCRDSIALMKLERAREAVINHFRTTFSTPYHEDLTTEERALLEKIIGDYEAAGGPKGIKAAEMGRLLTLLGASLERAKKAQSVEMFVRYKAFVDYANFNQDFASSDKKAGEQAHLKNLVHIAKALGLSDLLERYNVVSKGKYWGENVDRDNLYAMMNFVFALVGADGTSENIFGLDAEAQTRAQHAVHSIIEMFHKQGYISEDVSHKGGILGILAKDLHAEGGHGIFKRRDNLRFYGTGELKSGKAIDRVNFKVDSSKIKREEEILEAIVHGVVHEMTTESDFGSVQVTPAPDLLKDVTQTFSTEAAKIKRQLFRVANRTFAVHDAAREIRAMSGVDARVKEALARAVESSQPLGREGVCAHFFEGIVDSNEALVLYEPRLRFLQLPCFIKNIEAIVYATAQLASYQHIFETKGANGDIIALTNFDLETPAKARLATRAAYIKQRSALHRYVDRALAKFHYQGELTRGTLEEKLAALKHLALGKDHEVQGIRSQRRAIVEQLAELQTRGLNRSEYVEVFTGSVQGALNEQKAALVQNLAEAEQALEECLVLAAEAKKTHRDLQSDDAVEHRRAESEVLKLEAQVRARQADCVQAQRALELFELHAVALAEEITQVYDAYFQLTAKLSALVQKAVRGEVGFSGEADEFAQMVQGLASRAEESAPELALSLKNQLEQAKAEVVAHTLIRLNQDRAQAYEDRVRLDELEEVHGLADEHIAAEQQRHEREKGNIGTYQLGHEIKIRNQQAALRHEVREIEDQVEVLEERLEAKRRELEEVKHTDYNVMGPGVDHRALDQQRALASRLRSEILNLESQIGEHQEEIEALEAQIQQATRKVTVLKDRTYDRSRRELQQVFDQAMQALIPAKESALEEAAWLDTQLELRERDIVRLDSLVHGVGEVDFKMASPETQRSLNGEEALDFEPRERRAAPAREPRARASADEAFADGGARAASPAAPAAPAASPAAPAAPAASPAAPADSAAGATRAATAGFQTTRTPRSTSALAARVPSIVNEVQKAFDEEDGFFVDAFAGNQEEIYSQLSAHVKERVATLHSRFLSAQSREPIPVSLLLTNAPAGSVEQLKDDHIAVLIVEAIQELRTKAAVDTGEVAALIAEHEKLGAQSKVAEAELGLLHEALKEIQEELGAAGAAGAEEAVRELQEARATFDELKQVRDELAQISLDRIAYYEGVENTYKGALESARADKAKIDHVVENWSKLPKKKPHLELFDQLAQRVVADDESGSKAAFEALKRVPAGEIVVQGKKEEFIERQHELDEAVQQLEARLQAHQADVASKKLHEQKATLMGLLQRANELLEGELPSIWELSDEQIHGALTAVLKELKARIEAQVQENKEKYNDERIGELLAHKAEVAAEAAAKVKEIEAIEQSKRRALHALKGSVQREARVYELGFEFFGCPLSKTQAAEQFVLPASIDAVDLLGVDPSRASQRAAAFRRPAEYARPGARTPDSEGGDSGMGYASSEEDLRAEEEARVGRKSRYQRHKSAAAPAGVFHAPPAGRFEAVRRPFFEEEDDGFEEFDLLPGERVDRVGTWSELGEIPPYRAKASKVSGGLLGDRPWLEGTYRRA